MEKASSNIYRNENLNDKLDRLEAMLGKVGLKMGAQGLEILKLMDEIDQQVQDSIQKGSQIKTETGHYESLQHVVKREAKIILREIGGSSALDSACPARRQLPRAWWWRLDDYLLEKQRQERKRFLIGSAVLVGILGILVVVYNLFLAPDAVTVARFESRQNAEQLAASGDLEQALIELEKGLAVAPTDPELLVIKGCVLTLLKKETEAKLIFAAAEKSAGSTENFYMLRSQTWYVLGDPAASLADANEVITKVNPESAIGHLLAGSAQEALKQPKQATILYEKAYELADQQKNYQLAAQARIRLAYLSQSMMGSPFGGGN